MLQIIIALMLVQNVNSFSTTETPTLENINKIQKAVKVVRMIHGIKKEGIPLITLPDLKTKLSLFWWDRSTKTKIIILLVVGLILYIL